MPFSAHIKSVISKTRNGIGLLKYLSNYLPRKSLSQLYKPYVRPHMDYGIVIYHIPGKIYKASQNTTLPKLMGKLESVQYSSALAFARKGRRISRDKLYVELGWESRTSRRWGRRLPFFHNIINNLTLSYTKEPIPSPPQLTYFLRDREAV